MNLPNLLTISRVPLMFIVVGLLYADFSYAATFAFWLYIAAALTDWLDGYVARLQGQTSALGRVLDPLVDKVLVCGAFIFLLPFGNEPGWLTPWMVSRTSRMNAVVVFMGLVFWGWLWGGWGLLLGLPILMVFKAVCDHVEELKPIGEFMGE